MISVINNNHLTRFIIIGIAAINVIVTAPNSAFSNEETRYIFKGEGSVQEGENNFSCQHLMISKAGNFKLTCTNYQLSLGGARQSQSGKLYYRNASVTKKVNRRNIVIVHSVDIGCSINIKSDSEVTTLEKFKCAGTLGTSIFEADFRANEAIIY